MRRPKAGSSDVSFTVRPPVAPCLRV